jgi:anti-anti-sigma factor
VKHEDEVALVTWHGPLTLETVEGLAPLVRAHLSGERAVVLNLSETPYIDSTALGTLVELLEEIPDERLIIAGTYNIWRILDLVGLTEAYPGRILQELPEPLAERARRRR